MLWLRNQLTARKQGHSTFLIASSAGASSLLTAAAQECDDVASQGGDEALKVEVFCRLRDYCLW